MLLLELRVDDHRDIVIKDNILPDVGLSLINFQSVNTFFVDLLILKDLLKDSIFR